VPSALLENAFHVSVTHPVCSDLPSPISFVAFGRPQMPRAAMPKATVYKNRDTFSPKHKVRLSRQWQMPSPTFDAVLPKDSGETDFRVPVTARTNGSHDCGTLPLAEHINHFLQA